MNFYLPFYIHIFFLIILLGLFLLKLNIGFIIILFLYLLLLFLFRRNSHLIKYCPKTKGTDLFFCPVSGLVEDFLHNEKGYELVVKIPFWENKGVFLPCECEIEIKENDLELKYLSKLFASIQLFDNFSPRIWISSGDKGQRAANIGFLPFGGKIMIYLNDEYEILVQKNERVIAGETLLAVNKTGPLLKETTT